MPTNVTAEYAAAEKRYLAARSYDDKIAALQEMISECPKHKGTENLLMQLRQRLARFRKEQEAEKHRRKGKGKSLAVPKEGFQIAMIGFPNSGKSTLLAALTNARPKIAPYPFTTVEPEVGMTPEGLQLVEIPALVEGAREKQAELLSLVQNADGLIICLGDGAEHERRVLEAELASAGIRKPAFFVPKGKRVATEELFRFFNLIRVYTKEPGEPANREKPLVLRRGSTVLKAASEIHKDFADGLDYCRVWGSSRFAGQRVEKDYQLKDGDVVEFHARG